MTRTGVGNEQGLAPANYDPASPRKFTRLHLHGVQGARILSGQLHCNPRDYSFTNLFVRQNEATEAAFPAIIEPYLGEPILRGTRLLPVANNETDAQRAVAVEVTTVNGHTDLLFADGRPDRTRSVGGATVAGEFAYVSRDAEGLRAANLVGGTQLALPDLTLTVPAAAYVGKITAVDYGRRQMTVDASWPANTPALAEVGVPGHQTAYTVTAAQAAGNRSVLTTEGGADFYLSRVQSVDPGTNTVVAAIALAPHAAHNDRHWVASNEAQTKFWRADYLGEQPGGFGFRLRPLDPDSTTAAEPVKLSDFGATRGLRLWEYGVGDTVRMPAQVALRRAATGLYELSGNTTVGVAWAGKTVETSVDGQRWQGLRGGAMIDLTTADAAKRVRLVRVR
jgi:hypothetical protein